MNRGIRILLIVFLVIAVGAAGVFAFLKFGKSPVSVTARTLANMRDIESVSMNMKVDADVKAEVGILQFFGLGDPETTISMTYDIDAFKEENIAHANVKVDVFDRNLLENVEVIIDNGDAGSVQYYRINDNWYRYAAAPESIADGTTADSTTSDGTAAADAIMESAETEKLNASPANTSLKASKLSADAKNDTNDGQDSLYNPYVNATDSFVDFREILEGIENGDLTASMRKEKENIRGRECIVYDIDLTVDMLDKVIRLTRPDGGILSSLKRNEHIAGTLYIDSEESLPAALKLSTGEIIDGKLVLEQLGTTLTIKSIDIDIDVTGYNNAKTISVPVDYIDLDDLDELDTNQWFGLFSDLAGF